METIFINFISAYTKEKALVNRLWDEMNINYSHSSRHYHTLNHLQNLFSTLEPVKARLEDWEVILFTLFYHDIVYDVSRADNEEQSAVWAERVMKSLNLESARIERCKRHILATKSHRTSNDHDTNLFTDADLSILGSDQKTYTQYYSWIRKEYSIFPDKVYNEGRLRVLQSFLERPTVFKTEIFQNLYETNARINMANELKILSSI